jgi:hypothetical protein
MRNSGILFFILNFIFFFTNCQLFLLGDNPTYKELEQYIRMLKDSKAKYTYNQYEELLSELTNERYIVLPIYEMIDTINDSKIIVGMRHDVDHHPFKALEMAELENTYGLRTTYYFLATASYYGNFTNNDIERFACMEEVYQEIYSLGNEIGIHNDLLTVMIEHNFDPFDFNWNEILFYSRLGIEIKGTVAHGSIIAQKTGSNYQIFSDFADSAYVEYDGQKYEIGKYSLSEFGFNYEANFINYNKFYAESRGEWNVEGGLSQLIIKLRNSNPGDRIQILTHPVWWGK